MPDDNAQPVVAIPVDKQVIIDMFLRDVRGKKSDTAAANVRHSGKEGHWLETAMGIAHNASNSPDILGYEMKNGTSMKTTFGDWSADYYIYKNSKSLLERSDFLRIFGKPNAKKNGRFSWSGDPAPKIGKYNTFGQILAIDKNDNILALYRFSRDTRPNKAAIVPKLLQREGLILARWDAEAMRKRVERKFNNKGWFICEKNDDGTYVSIAFGEPITFESWLTSLRAGDIFFDSGMYDGNPRPYSQWRAHNNFWHNLITSRYS